jgi:hypothetical protein
MTMKKIFILALLIIATGLTPAVAGDSADLQRVLEERYNAMKSAMANRDANSFSALLTPDFVSTDVSGQTERAAQTIEEIKQLPVDSHKTSKTAIRSIKLDGTIAHVEQSYDMTTIKTAANGTVQHIELRTISEDVWMLSNGVWLCKSTTTDQLDYSINGQVLAHKTRQR